MSSPRFLHVKIPARKSAFTALLSRLIIDDSKFENRRTTFLAQFWYTAKYTYEGWNFNSGNYLFTTDTK